MPILLALAAAAAAPGVSYTVPPLATPARNVSVVRDRGVVLTHAGPRRHAPAYVFIRRGGFVPSYFAHPGFAIRQPGFYGFRQPFAGGRWIRYHDDALLVDRYGRVHDGRYGQDWSRDRDRWGHDGYGIPVYVGDGDFYPEDRDYAWAERFERDGDGQLAYDRDYPYDSRYGGEGVRYGADAPCAFPCGYTITETTVTLPTTYREVTTYEDVVSYDNVRTHRPARRYASKGLRR